MGTVVRDGKRLGFLYDAGWLVSPHRYPLSLSMPPALKEHPHSVIEPFLWGLLPDNPRILEVRADRASRLPANETTAWTPNGSWERQAPAWRVPRRAAWVADSRHAG